MTLKKSGRNTARIVGDIVSYYDSCAFTSSFWYNQYSVQEA